MLDPGVKFYENEQEIVEMTWYLHCIPTERVGWDRTAERRYGELLKICCDVV